MKQYFKGPSVTGAAICALLLMVVMILQIPAYGIHSSASLQTVAEKISAGLDPAVYPQQNQIRISRYLGVDPSSIGEAVLFRNDDAMSASEMVIARFENEEQKKAFEKAVRERIDSQHSIYEGYAPEQAAVMNQAVVDLQDNYGLYYAGDQGKQVSEAFEQALREGESA